MSFKLKGLLAKRNQAIVNFKETKNRKYLDEFFKICRTIDKLTSGKKNRNLTFSFGSKIEEGARKRLENLHFNEKDFFYLSPGMHASTRDSFSEKFFGMSFSLSISDIIYGDGCISYIISLRSGGRIFFCCIDIDLISKTCQIQVGLMNGPGSYLAAEENTKALLGMTYLIMVPRYKSRVWTEKRISGISDAERRNYPVNISDDVKITTLPFRRRTIEKLSDTSTEVQDLLNKVDKDILGSVRKKYGNIFVNVHYGFGRPKKSIRCVGRIAVCLASNIPCIEHAVKTAIDNGQKAVVSIHGGYVPRELDGLSAGTPKRPHLRRQKGKVSMVNLHILNSLFGGVGDIFRRKVAGQLISKTEEFKLLKCFKAVGISDYQEYGLHFTTGKKHYGHHKGGASSACYVFS